jgi:hypothetical protein
MWDWPALRLLRSIAIVRPTAYAREPRLIHYLLCRVADLDIFERTQKPKYLKQIDHDRDNHDRVQYPRDLRIHGDIGIDQPQKHTNHDQKTY